MSYEEYKSKLVRFYEKHKRLPGYKEIMAFTGFRSKNAVFKFIEKLVDDNVVRKDTRGRLSPYLLGGGVRLLGLVEAGFPSAAEEELLDTMDFDEFLTPNKVASYILRVKGDSMINAGISSDTKTLGAISYPHHSSSHEFDHQLHAVFTA